MLAPEVPRRASTVDVRVLAVRVVAWLLVGVYLVFCAMIAGTVGIWPLTAWAGYVVVGALLLSVRAGSRIGAMMLAIGFYWAGSGLLYLPGAAEQTPAWLELAVSAASPLVWGLVPMLLVLYPDDHLGSRLGRAVAAVVACVVVTFTLAHLVVPAPLEFSGRPNPLASDTLAAASAFMRSDATFVVVPALVVAALVDLMLRWRRSSGPRRYQFRWFAYGGGITAVILVVILVAPPLPQPAAAVIELAFNVLPVSILIALTRHGLYEVDRVISRTVAYAIVTLFAVGVYAAVVTSVTWLVPELPSIGIALATLAAAALFLPVLRWVQRRVDRRFDREQYHATRVVDAFGVRLRGRVDPSVTADDLVEAVDRALHPASIGLWTNGGRS